MWGNQVNHRKITNAILSIVSGIPVKTGTTKWTNLFYGFHVSTNNFVVIFKAYK